MCLVSAFCNSKLFLCTVESRCCCFYNLLHCFLLRFSRGSVQTVLPPNKKLRTGRLCSSYDEQIKKLEQQASVAERNTEESRKRKRDVESYLNNLQVELKNAKVNAKLSYSLWVCFILTMMY